jgi:hypothetical protein
MKRRSQDARHPKALLAALIQRTYWRVALRVHTQRRLVARDSFVWKLLDQVTGDGPNTAPLRQWTFPLKCFAFFGADERT